MTDEHFSAVASRYHELRPADSDAVLCVRDHLLRQPSRGVDVGCGTGQYTQALYDKLPEGTIIVAADLNRAMLRELCARVDPEAPIIPVQLRAENLPLRPESVDWVTTFNAIHHMDIHRFLKRVAKILKPGGKLFIYTRTPEQNAQSIWGRLFPGFTEKEVRLRSETQLRESVEATGRLEVTSVRNFRYERTSTPQRLREQAESAHYSTFNLYTGEEFHRAVETFLRRVPRDSVRWHDENLLLVARRIP